MRKDNVQKPDSSEKPDEDLRKAYKEQAKELQEYKETWRPTWKALGFEFTHKQMARGATPAPKWMKKTP